MISWYGSLRMAASLVITDAEVDEALRVLDTSLLLADREAGAMSVTLSRSTEFGRRLLEQAV